MNLVKFSKIDKLINLDDSKLVNFEIEDKKVFVEIIDSVISNSDEITLTIKGKLAETSKYTKTIINPFELDLSSKKNINLILQTIQNKLASDEDLNTFEKISESLFDLAELLFGKLDFKVSYSTDLELIDLLSVLEVKIESSNSLIEKIILYLKVISELSSIRVIFTVNILSFLSGNDILLLHETLVSQDITLINFSHNSSAEELIISKYVLDKDNCLI